MRILGIDYGTKRVGVALSDESRKFALPLVVLKNTEGLMAEVVELTKKHGVDLIVIGESRKNDMTPNSILPSILAFKEKLESVNVKTVLELEFMTSQQAERLQGKNDKLDASAAALILQAYLDRDHA